jgi:uncharacterized membrane protein YfbV (UPF0208 family)
MSLQTRRHVTVTDIPPASLLVPPMAATAFLWATSANELETSAVVFAFFLLLIPWGSYLYWQQGKRDHLPLFAMVSGAYWVYFALALFWGSRTFSAAAFAAITPTESTITEATWMALVGVVCLWFGMRMPVSIWVPSKLPDVFEHRASWAYVRAVLIAGVALGLRPGSAWIFGAEGRQLMITLTTVVPDVAFVLLFDRYLTGRSARIDRWILVTCGAAKLLGGLASGWLGPTVWWGVTCGALFLMRRRTFPVVPIALTIALILFLQVAKTEFRSMYWYSEQAETGIVDRVQFWFETAASKWSDALQSGDRTESLGLASQSVHRASLLTQVAHVLEMTPSQVPFLNGDTYRFLAVTLIPRALWPDKPTVNDANRFYQVAYGLTAERRLDSVSIAVGSLAEGFINFGWPGVVGVMVLIGIILGVYQRTLVVAESSTLFLAIGLTLVPGLLAVESQLGQYLGGIVQQMLLTIAVFLPIVRRRIHSVQPSGQRLPPSPVFQS